MTGDVNLENREALEYYGKTPVMTEMEPLDTVDATTIRPLTGVTDVVLLKG